MRTFPTTVLALSVLAGGACTSDVPVVEQTGNPIGFERIQHWTLEVDALPDSEVDELMTTLDRLLSGMGPGADVAKESRLHLWRFANRLRTGTMTDSQVQAVLDHLRQLSKEYPAAAANFEQTAFLVDSLRIGVTAPNIVGSDAYGEEFELADYRGKVVVLVFSGQWCGPCRSEYPYQRLMTEVYADRPFAIVGVNSDSLEVAKTYMAENDLHYRSFWDGPTTEGPIATRWNVTGWPTVYVLDHEGRIRFVDARHEATLKAVAQLMEEIPREPAPATPAPVDST